VLIANPIGTGQELKDLRNELWIVQVPELQGRRRNDLEILLSIFDQENRMSDHHILNLNVERFSDEYRPIVRRLQQAIADREVREAMDVEDDVVEHFRTEERIRQNIIAEQEAALAV
jgi:hypothetical protein